ncbi:MAG: glycosyltransferase [Flavobacteriaceae bacterium]|nr:glycosyltransferase [Flavobacteriaceae bacterium]|tara:strand:- start:11915 stop:13150 length:1236 start_codon:yes stop_codon:yes gene_type:complete
MKRLLIIGHTFPEANTTAAGVRMMQLVHLFLKAEYEIVFCSTAEMTPYSETFDKDAIRWESIRLNDASFDHFIRNENPSVVLFDRFITEEQFGWRVSENCPEALKILDTEDLHFLRKAREEAVKNQGVAAEAHLYTEIAKRELASILRCDLSLIISEYEYALLTETFQIPKTLLYYLPFLATAPSEAEKNSLPDFQHRQHFVTMGNFQHAPNADAVRYLKTEIWPAIRKQLPNAKLHIYGAYASKSIMQLHNEQNGFFIQGWAPDADEVLKKAKVCVAPLRFGAGLKGKILKAWAVGTPVITTAIGIEGMGEGLYPSFEVGDPEAWGKEAARLYNDETYWQKRQGMGFSILEQKFASERFETPFMTTLEEMIVQLQTHRKNHFITQILQHHTVQTYKYLSKYIAEKNQNAN